MDKSTSQLSTTVLVSVLGQSLEWYDFFTYGVLAPVLGDLFFPSHNPYLSLIATLAVFAVGFLMRPIGGIVFGYASDKFGRKTIFVITLLCMSLSTAFVGFLPTYAQAGILAPCLLIIMRLIQGISVGGECTGSVVYLSEHVPHEKRGFFTSWLLVAVVAGWLLASLVSAGLVNILSHDQFNQWGWRIPFILGLFTGIIGVFLRLKARETPQFEKLREEGKIAKNPLKEAFKTVNLHSLVFMAWLVSGPLSFYLLLVYLPIYMNKIGGLQLSTSLALNAFSALICIIMIPLMGKLSDHIGRKTTLIIGGIGFIILSPMVFYMASLGTLTLSFFTILIATVLFSIYSGPFYGLMGDWYPVHIRGTATAAWFNVITAIAGGTAPLVSTLLIQQTGSGIAPGFYLSAWALISVFSLLLYQIPKHTEY